MGREMTLKRALREARREHDVILIDCPPALGLLTVNALVAATHALISAEGEYFSLQGVEQVLEVMGLARENLNDELEWLGVVLNITDLRRRHAREALASLRESHGDKVFETVIRKSVRYPESAERGVTILDYRPELGIDYIALGEELLERLGEEEARRVSAAARAIRRTGTCHPARERASRAGPGPGPLASAGGPPRTQDLTRPREVLSGRRGAHARGSQPAAAARGLQRLRGRRRAAGGARARGRRLGRRSRARLRRRGAAPPRRASTRGARSATSRAC